MCKKEKCGRHEFNAGLCLPHLKEALLGIPAPVVEEAPVEKPKRKRTTKKKVDSEELEVRDAE